MFRSHSFVLFILTIVALVVVAMLITACGLPVSGPAPCCCVTTNNMKNCYPVSGQQECPDGVVGSCASMFDVQSIPSDGGGTGGGH